MASSEKQKEVCMKKYSSMMIEYLPRNSRAGCLPKTKLEESETCQSRRVLCSIFSSNLTEELGRERIWMDLSFLHIWMQDVVAVAGLVLDGSERNILHGLQWPHSFSILQERREGSSLDSHQARHSSNLHGPWGLQEFSQAKEIQNFLHRTRSFSTRLFYQMVGRISTRPGFQDEVLAHIHLLQQIC